MSLKPVVTISDDRLRTLGTELMANMEQQGFVPDAVIGIATGGLRVVEAMPRHPSLTVMSCRLRRPGTAAKEGNRLWLATVRRLPYVLTNLLRVLEDRVHARRVVTVRAPTETLLREVTWIKDEVIRKGIKRVVVVDDAVDSGATLACVMAALRDSLPPSVELRSAVITVTRDREQRAIDPDFRLFDLTLLRFPWSFDYKAAR